MKVVKPKQGAARETVGSLTIEVEPTEFENPILRSPDIWESQVPKSAVQRGRRGRRD